MEVVLAIFILFIFALFITALFSWLFGSRGPWGSYWTFFLVIFLFTWSATLWITPAGPVYYGVAWIPIMVVGLLIAFFLIAVTPPYFRSKRNSRIRPEDPDLDPKTSPGWLALDVFFWVVVIILILSILFSYG